MLQGVNPRTVRQWAVGDIRCIARVEMNALLNKCPMCGRVSNKSVQFGARLLSNKCNLYG